MDRWDRQTDFGCNSCMFFVPKKPSVQDVLTGQGRCRRNAPTLKGFPVVYVDDWCGEHKLGSNPIRDKHAKEKEKWEDKD